ncbi:MAG: RNA polymerase sigma factor RpoD/SigA, partial [Treponema sp.]|nr:RNA polymerase sigma factor RpoD/SigA [Treponema sp.]
MEAAKTFTPVYDDENVLNLYLKEINKIPLLSREEENELALKAKAGDKAAKDKIVSANLRFVVNVAKKYQSHGLDLTDLISEGNIGLLTAIDHFDVEKGYHFISYAVWWIRQAILKAICEKSRAIRLPLNRANELVQIEKTRKAIGHKKNEDSEFREIGKMLGMSPSHVRELVNLGRDMISLDARIAGDDTGRNTVADFIEDTYYASPDYQAINNSMKDDIDSVLNTL